MLVKMRYLLRIVILSSILISGFINVYGQPKLEINCAVSYIEVDNLKNIYVVSETELTKYNSLGKILYRFSNKINGEITSIDVTNPLRIILFHRESNTITFLNNQLSKITQSIDIFSVIGIEAANAGASTQGGFWIYSVDNQSVMLYNSQLKMIQESQSLSYWIKGDDIKDIREQNQKLYLVLQERVVVLDLFGSYLTTIHLNNALSIKISANRISYMKDKKLYFYNLSLKNDIEIAIPVEVGENSIFYFEEQIYIISNNKILIY